jgi:GcrA cell cycle regulator
MSDKQTKSKGAQPPASAEGGKTPPAAGTGEQAAMWDDEKIGRLKKLWSEGLTTGEIGKRLGVSKNAVVGKAHRLGLKGRPSPIKRQPNKPVEPKKETRVFTLTDLSAQTCRWPIGDPKHEDFRFCGKPVYTGKPYCSEHCAVAYVGSGKSSRSEDAA